MYFPLFLQLQPLPRTPSPTLSMSSPTGLRHKSYILYYKMRIICKFRHWILETLKNWCTWKYKGTYCRTKVKNIHSTDGCHLIFLFSLWIANDKKKEPQSSFFDNVNFKLCFSFPSFSHWSTARRRIGQCRHSSLLRSRLHLLLPDWKDLRRPKEPWTPAISQAKVWHRSSAARRFQTERQA